MSQGRFLFVPDTVPPKMFMFIGFSLRAALKGTNLRGQTPICGFLRVPAIFCGFLRKSAVFCENPRFPNALFSRKRRESAKISENQRKSAFGLGLSP